MAKSIAERLLAAIDDAYDGVTATPYLDLDVDTGLAAIVDLRAIAAEVESVETALRNIGGGRGVPDHVLESGELFGWAQKTARAARRTEES